jgi:hypothetical protein
MNARGSYEEREAPLLHGIRIRRIGLSCLRLNLAPLPVAGDMSLALAARWW